MNVAGYGRVHSKWELRPLPEVLFFQEGPGLRRWQWRDSGMKVINGKNILPDGTFDPTNTERFIDLDEFEARYRHFAIDVGDIVVTSSGTIGKVARIRADHLPMMMNTSVIRFRSLDPTVIADDYVYAFLRSPLFSTQADVAATGAAQRNFGPAHLRQMVVPVPPLPIQQKVIAVLSACDKLIENNLRRIEILEEIAQATYREWFVEFRYPRHEDMSLVDSGIGNVPGTWQVRPLGDVLTVLESGSRPRGGAVQAGVPSIGAENILGLGRYDFSKEKYVDEEYFEAMNRGRVEPGDVLLYKDGAHIGRMSMTGRGFPHDLSAINEHVFRLRADSTLGQEFLFFHLSDQAVNRRIVDLNSNAAQPGISQTRLKALLVLVPEHDLLRAFTNRVRANLDLIFNLAKSNRLLAATRDLLLPKLVTGELDVSELDLDDVA